MLREFHHKHAGLLFAKRYHKLVSVSDARNLEGIYTADVSRSSVSPFGGLTSHALLPFIQKLGSRFSNSVGMLSISLAERDRLTPLGKSFSIADSAIWYASASAKAPVAPFGSLALNEKEISTDSIRTTIERLPFPGDTSRSVSGESS